MTSENSTDESSEERELTAMEERFLAGFKDEEPDEFDEELMELTKTRDRGSVLRPILMLLVIVVVSSVIYDWRDEIDYFFSPSEALELGDTTRFSARSAEDPDWRPPVEHNRYVSIEGTPTRISRGGGYEFFRLVGGEFYVQRKYESENDRDGPISQVPERNMGPGVMVDEHRTRYEGEGRLISFASNPHRVDGLKNHFGEQYNLRFCEDYNERQIQDLEERRLETMRSNWRQRFESASENQREIDGLTPEPTEADEAYHLNQRPVCVDAYLIHDGQRPIDQWWYVLFSALLGLFVLFTIFKLVRWFQAWLKP